MADPLFEDIAKLHREIHTHDAPPAHERERQAAYIRVPARFDFVGEVP